MPIQKDMPIGKHKNVTVVQFGTGDILISDGHDAEDINNKVLVLSQDIEKPEADWDKAVPTGGDTDNMKDPVFLYFNNVKSVDAVMRALERIKANLISNSNGIANDGPDHKNVG